MRIYKGEWITADNYGQQKMEFILPSLKLIGKFEASTLPY